MIHPGFKVYVPLVLPLGGHFTDIGYCALKEGGMHVTCRAVEKADCELAFLTKTPKDEEILTSICKNMVKDLSLNLGGHTNSFDIVVDCGFMCSLERLLVGLLLGCNKIYGEKKLEDNELLSWLLEWVDANAVDANLNILNTAWFGGLRLFYDIPGHPGYRAHLPEGLQFTVVKWKSSKRMKNEDLAQVQDSKSLQKVISFMKGSFLTDFSAICRGLNYSIQSQKFYERELIEEMLEISKKINIPAVGISNWMGGMYFLSLNSTIGFDLVENIDRLESENNYSLRVISAELDLNGASVL